jgi:hypothetical protein
MSDAHFTFTLLNPLSEMRPRHSSHAHVSVEFVAEKISLLNLGDVHFYILVNVIIIEILWNKECTWVDKPIKQPPTEMSTHQQQDSLQSEGEPQRGSAGTTFP